MSKKVVIAEKPSVGKDIARVLNCSKSGNGFMEGKDYIVTWALGHLVTLADPEQYGKQYGEWKIEDLPIIPKKLKTVVIKQTSKQFNTVKYQVSRKDVSEIIIGTDAGREGELVARWIIEKIGSDKPIKRLWISSVTEKAIKDGFKNLKDGKLYENLYSAALARSEADWYIGINATRALTCKHNAQLSCGRVQTPTLAIVQKREEEIKNFKSRKYYGIEAEINGLVFKWTEDKSGNSRTFSEEKADSLLKSIERKEALITDIDVQKKKSYPPKLYDLTELQKDTNRIYGYSGKETLSVVQSLYEKHKALTYPRTDSSYISDDMVETIPDRIKACAVDGYSKYGAMILRSGIKTNSSFVDSRKVTDHHALIPTEQRPIISDLNDKERKVYELVVKRFLSVLMPPFEYEETKISAKIGDETFKTSTKLTVSKGYKQLLGEDEIPAKKDVSFSKQMKIAPSKIRKTSGETSPPARFTEGNLLGAMESPGKYMETDDKALLNTIDKTGGIGTVATRADIIDKLFNSYMLEKSGKEIMITSKGKQLLNLAPEKLKSPILTAEWEQKLESISKGKLKKQDFLNDMIEYTKEIVSEIKSSSESFKHDNLTRSKCPECGKFMLEVNGKKGKMLVCQDRECGEKKSISRVTNARCPECKKKMEMRGSGDSKIFICKCGYREKLSAFNKRKSQQKSKLSKNEVKNYLKKQEDENINSALADALAKLKLD